MTVVLRQARSTDAGAAGDILWRFQSDTGWMPDLYSGAETIAFCGAMIDRGWVSVAETDTGVIGFLARDGEEICALYVLDTMRGQGIGRQLIEADKAAAPRLHLRVFRANAGARRFYRSQGFVECGRDDGSENPENLPEIHYVWSQEAET